jgi:DNA-binding MarR family transcriptional regulator
MATGTTSSEDPRQRLAYLLRRMNVELDQLGHEFAAQHRLHPTDMRALIAIMDADRSGQTMTPGRLGEELNLASPSVTALADRLERQGHLRRVRDHHDRPRVTLEIEPRALTLGQSSSGRSTPSCWPPWRRSARPSSRSPAASWRPGHRGQPPSPPAAGAT